MQHILTPFAEHLSCFQRTCSFLQQDSAVYNTANNFICCIQSSCQQNHKKGILSLLLPDLKLCCIYLWDMLQNKVYGCILGLKVI